MDFSAFDESDWNFLEAAVTVGLEAPDVTEAEAEQVEALLRLRVEGEAWVEDNADSLREAFAIGWNVATENGTNDLAARHGHVAEALGVVPPAQPSA